MLNLEKFVYEEENLLDKVDGKKPQVDKKSKNNIKWSVDEPTSDDASYDLDLNSSNNTESLDDLIDKFDTEEDFFILGKAGWGKTSIIRKLAEKYGRKVITVYLDKAEAADLGGMPTPVKSQSKAKVKNALGKYEIREFGKMLNSLPEWAALMLENNDQDFLLFFDEMNQAQPDVMNALMPIVLEHEICGVKFDNFFVGAAGNYEDENGAVNELSKPLESRFKPIIEWEVNTKRAWKQVFKYLHSKWDKYLTKDFVDAFENAATCFNNPREIEMKLFQYVYRMKVNGGERNDASRYLRRLKNIAVDDLSRSQEKMLEGLADKMFSFVGGKDDKKSDSSGSSRRSKGSTMVPEAIRVAVEYGMKNGYINATIEDENGNDKQIMFGVSAENIKDLVDMDECNAEMLNNLIHKYEIDGIKWKYDKSPNWKDLGFEDPTDPKWKFEINKNTVIKIPKQVKKTPKD